MATSRINIGSKFQNGDIPSQSDFVEIFDSFVHKDEDKADFEMVETGTDDQHYVTPALLRTGLQNIGIITGNCYMPFKEPFDNFSGTTLSLEKLPIQHSIKVYKNGQLLQEGEDYTVDYNTAVITFSGTVGDRNIEVDYWFKNLGPIPGGDTSEPIDFTSFLHTAGNETKNGLLTFNNTTPTSTSGLVLTNSGAGVDATALDITVTGTGSGILLQNSSTGTGVKVSNTGVGSGVYLNSAATATGDILQVAKDNVVKVKIEDDGVITAPKYVTSGATATQFVKGDGSLDGNTYSLDTDVIHTTGNESKDGALSLTHDASAQDVLTITKNNSANCLKLVQNSSSNATTSTFDTTTANNNRKAISIRKLEQENAFITHEGNVTATSFTTFTAKADITDGLLTLAGSDSPAATAGNAKLYAKTDGTTDMYVMGSDGVEKKIGGVVDLSGKENTITPGTTAQYYRGDKSWQTLNKTAVGLANIDNTSDLNKPVSTATQAALSNVLHKTGYATETKSGELVIDSGIDNFSGFTLKKIPTIPFNGTISLLATTPTPFCIIKATDGNFYLTANDAAGTIYKMTSAGVITIFVTGITSYTRGICQGNDGNLYVLSFTGGTINKITLSGVVTLFATLGGNNHCGLTLANDGNFYATNSLGIIKITSAGTVSTFVAIASDKGGICQGIDGNLYYSDYTASSTKRVSLLGIVTTFVAGCIGVQISLGENGNLYTAYSQNINKISTEGVVTFYPTGINSLQAVYPDNNGVLYVTSTSNAVYRSVNMTQKVLKTDSNGLIVKTQYLEDVQYLKSSDINLSTYAKLDSPLFTGVPIAPTAAVGTSTTQIATTAFVNNIRPYKVYTAILTQSGTNPPSAAVLENTLGGTIVWGYLAPGIYSATLSGAFPANKTSVMLTLGGTAGAGYMTQIFGTRGDNNSVRIGTVLNDATSTGVDGRLNLSTLEIRVYN